MAITNAGLIENVGNGGTQILSAITNNGTLEASTAGTLTLMGVVSGTGSAKIAAGGTLFADNTFNQSVTFTGATGVFKLLDWTTYTASVKGLSTAGTNAIDLAGMTFSSLKSKATFSGTATSGVLTITNGTVTATINLTGDYLGSTFMVSNDGHGGTKVVDPPAPSTPAVAPADPMVQAIAAFQVSPPSGMAGTPAWQVPKLPMFSAGH